MPYADSEAMTLHPQAIARAISSAHGLLVVDGAGWHASHIVRPPDNISLLCLPPYPPELNPVETLREHLRQNKLALRIHDRYDDIVDAYCKTWTDLIADPARLMSITARNWANAS
jgi:transposase